MLSKYKGKEQYLCQGRGKDPEEQADETTELPVATIATPKLLNRPGLRVEDCIEHQVLSGHKFVVVGLRVAV
jgi:hypothetical protein